MNTRIGLFGGAFDPFTKCHKKVIESLFEQNIVDKIYILPCYKSAYDKNMQPFEDRIKMCQMVANEFENVIVSDFEKKYNFNGQTYPTLLKFFETHKDINTDYYFIIGMDNANKIDTWDNWEEILKIINFIIIPRPNYIRDNKKWYNKDPHILLDIEENHGSSTEVRNDIKNNRKSNLIDDYIYDYIVENKLYK